jgi:putative FmdB family regulatory protein
MPTYQYQCSKGHSFELFQRISDKPKAKCPTCGARATRVITGGAGLIFKGSGFYITDYGKDGKGARKETTETEAASKPADQANPAPAGKTEPTPAQKSTTKKPDKAAE